MGQEELSGAGTASPTRHVRSRLPAWSWGEPLAKERREMGLFIGKRQEAVWMNG